MHARVRANRSWEDVRLLNTPETTDLENETRRAKRRDDDCGRKKDSRKDEEDEEDEDEAEEERRNSAGLVGLAVELFGGLKKKMKKKLKLKLKKIVNKD